MKLTIPEMKTYLKERNIPLRGGKVKTDFAQLIWNYKKSKHKNKFNDQENEIETKKNTILHPINDLKEAFLYFKRHICNEIRLKNNWSVESWISVISWSCLSPYENNSSKDFFFKIHCKNADSIIHVFLREDENQNVFLLGMEKNKTEQDKLIVFEANCDQISVTIDGKTIKIFKMMTPKDWNEMIKNDFPQLKHSDLFLDGMLLILNHCDNIDEVLYENAKIEADIEDSE